MIGLYLLLVLVWLSAWVLVLFDYRQSVRCFDRGMRYVWLVTIGVVVASAVVVGESL